MKTILVVFLSFLFAVPGFSDERVKQVSLSITTEQNALSTTAEVIAVVDQLRHSSLIKNLDASITVYVGPAGVTSSNGMPLSSGQSVTIHSTGPIYAIAASGTPTIAILHEVER